MDPFDIYPFYQKCNEDPQLVFESTPFWIQIWIDQLSRGLNRYIYVCVRVCGKCRILHKLQDQVQWEGKLWHSKSVVTKQPSMGATSLTIRILCMTTKVTISSKIATLRALLILCLAMVDPSMR
jgi:hypothetical protein